MKRHPIKDTKIGKWILAELKKNLNGKWKRIQGDKCAAPVNDPATQRSNAQDAIRDIYNRIWGPDAMQQLTEQTGLIFPKWGEKFDGDAQYGGFDPVSHNFIAVGLRICRSVEDWDSGVARAASPQSTGNKKTLRTRDSKGHYRPQIAICFDDPKFYDKIQEMGESGGGKTERKRVYDPTTIPGWDKIQIVPILFEIPIIGKTDKYNPAAGEEIPLRLQAKEESRHSDPTSPNADEDEELINIHERAGSLIAMGRKTLASWNKKLDF